MAAIGREGRRTIEEDEDGEKFAGGALAAVFVQAVRSRLAGQSLARDALGTKRYRRPRHRVSKRFRAADLGKVFSNATGTYRTHIHCSVLRDSFLYLVYIISI
jgi:hypothetical protein